MQINWFPGHMNRARREIAAAISKADVVIELVDARLPRSSRNPLLESLARTKPVLTVLAKADLADPETTAAWLAAWPGDPPLALSMNDPRAVRAIPERCRHLAPHRGGPGRTLRTLVVGIPNVGKSTLINSLTGRRIARVGDRPAITRRAQRFELDADLSIFDSPGVLWPRLDDQDGARRLAASGAIGEAAFETIDIAGWAVCFVATRYREALAERFGLEDELDGILRTTSDDPADASRAVRLLEAVGRRRGALRGGGHVDLDRTADLFLRELRTGRIGAISFERPDDFVDDQPDEGREGEPISSSNSR
ncbi:MAG TPA: ribosome biogenesis GTPase YlqF [Deltaproteobacteria bacterium]|nr:ribosome biogenesis GTPase YlqF [Deltaproteobacteria bacterium]